MAILQPYAINGVSGNFWVTTGIYISPDYSFARPNMNFYTSQSAYVSGSLPLYTHDPIIVNNPINVKKLAAIIEPSLLMIDPLFVGGSIVSGF